MPIQAGLWEEEIENCLPPIPLGWLVFASFAGLLFLPLSIAAGWAQVGVGPSAGALAALVKTGLYAVFLHAVLVWPLCGFVFSQQGQRWGVFERVAVCLLLISPPLVSFLYFLCGDGLTDVWDLALTVVPAVAWGALLYERSQRPWLFSLALALATSLPWLWLGDRLGGFSPVFTYGVLSNDCLSLRLAVAALALVAAAVGGAASAPLGSVWLRTAAKCLAALAGLHLAVGVVLPVIGLLLGKSGEGASPHWALVGFPWLMMFCLQPTWTGRRALGVVFSVVVLGEVGELVWRSLRLQPNPASLAQWGACWLSTGAVAFLATQTVFRNKNS